MRLAMPVAGYAYARKPPSCNTCYEEMFLLLRFNYVSYQLLVKQPGRRKK